MYTNLTSLGMDESYNSGNASNILATTAAYTTMIGNTSKNGTQDEYERKFMSDINFTDDMYDILLTTDDTSNVHSTCMDSMYELGQSYRMVHGYISLVVCIAGILMNILIIMVLTRKEMLTPINRMLTALAIADMLVMVEYIPFALHMYIFELPEEEQYSHIWAVFVLLHSHFTQVLHTINIQLTISMSIWRYLALKFTAKSSAYLTMARCNLCILAAYICPVLICIPNYLTFSIYHRQKFYLQPPFDTVLKMKEIEPSYEPHVIKMCEQMNEFFHAPLDCTNMVKRHDWYIVELSQMAKANDGLLNRINFWIFSVLVKLIPCLVLTFFMLWLVNTLYKAKRRHKMLQRNSGVPLTTVAGSCTNAGGSSVKVGNVNQNRQKRMQVQGSLEEEPEHHTKRGNTVQKQLHPLNTNNIASACSTNESQTPASKTQFTNGSNGDTNNITLDTKVRRDSNLHDNALPSTDLQLLPPSRRNNSIDVNDCPCQPPKASLFSFLLSKVNQRRLSTVSNCSVQLPINNINRASQHGAKKVGKRSDRTSKLLIAVLFLFLLTEFPQGVMALLSGIYGEQFFKKCYNTFAEVWDILALINSAINFILYCFMSKQFRLQFHNIVNIWPLFKKANKNEVSNTAKELLLSQRERRPTIV